MSTDIYIYIYISVVSFQSKIKKNYTCCRKFRKLLAFFSENKKAPKIVRTEASLLSFCHSPYEGHKHHGVIKAPWVPRILKPYYIVAGHQCLYTSSALTCGSLYPQLEISITLTPVQGPCLCVLGKRPNFFCHHHPVHQQRNKQLRV